MEEKIKIVAIALATAYWTGKLDDMRGVRPVYDEDVWRLMINAAAENDWIHWKQKARHALGIYE
jgi:hypothetical protein